MFKFSYVFLGIKAVQAAQSVYMSLEAGACRYLQLSSWHCHGLQRIFCMYPSLWAS